MSDESESEIEKTFINQLQAKYPIVKAKGSVDQLYGVTGFPTIFTVDANGNLHSRGMPSSATLETLLQGASMTPKMPADARFDAVRGMWQKKEHAKLRDWLAKQLAQDKGKLDPELREQFTAQLSTLERRAKGQSARVAALGQGPDYLQAKQQLETIAKQWRGFAAADEADREIKRFAEDATIKKEISALKALQRLTANYDTSRLAQARKLGIELTKFAADHEGTFAARKAQEQAAQLPKR